MGLCVGPLSKWCSSCGIGIAKRRGDELGFGHASWKFEQEFGKLTKQEEKERVQQMYRVKGI